MKQKSYWWGALDWIPMKRFTRTSHHCLTCGWIIPTRTSDCERRLNHNTNMWDYRCAACVDVQKNVRLVSGQELGLNGPTG